MNTVNAFGKFSSICRSLNMEQGGSTGDVPLETLNCRVDLTDLLRNIEEEEYANKVEIDDEEATSAEDLLAEELLGALERNEALEVWELVKKKHSILSKTSLYQDIANLEKNSPENSKSFRVFCRSDRKSCSVVRSDAEDDQKNNARKRRWIKILSNPLFIGVEWLWRSCHTDKNEDVEDVIENALEDSYQLEKIAWHEQDVYKSSVKAYETFATDVLEESTLDQFYEIMNAEGDDSVLDEKPRRVTTHKPRRVMKHKQSLSLLKIAANKGRKKFVAGPRCQFILNLVTFEGWPDWKSKSWVEKTIRWFVHFLLSTIIAPIYILLRLIGKVCPSKSNSACFLSNNHCQRCVQEVFEWVHSLYESPFSKFVNHTMSYIILLCLLFWSTMGNEVEYYSEAGLDTLDYAVLVFVLGLSLRDIVGAYKQGTTFYFSKWWNVMHVVTLSTFLVSYSVWLIAWEIYGEWEPRKVIFTVADVLYATATVMEFFHFTYVFQTNSTLGRLQLSLFRMVKDVMRFLLIFIMLFLAFAAGVVKVYAYYVSSQVKLSRELGNSTYAEDHPYAKHDLTAYGLIWLLFGNVDEDKILVDDPAFSLISVFGRIFLIAYVVCVSMVALNMLIAMMNNSYETITDEEWKLTSTQIWLDYMNEGNSIPVPFNLVYYSLSPFYIPIYCFRKCRKKEKQSIYREKRMQAMKYSVARYLKKNFLLRTVLLGQAGP
ncbi:short transient receptor potential channel 4-like isoform X3 [Stylophora pistillata]|uniref:short transient receptor potential channel 4-like isoform X3 n=1 Tax=Stylophora pistillata TaxID=50429 RepID=UPI000C046162|nr:short transient receptor potential channel 4-like isoform X3 [Stylophora pistillata]XP_022789678.1 short transient receptor potential channel 4-like isoform X3 [Stylophora pistillata]XP_022789679.1 short transient receptor potential channel 4-like isoform X3 [Stylophora pistillata]XP_022789680.1 short transient receptor potential channel 4-like isoform X3 [Stylophora pistillata]XP_022789681.1 short transient receptor potential channel 4-like isoform X3 [Stylophora pistillata]